MCGKMKSSVPMDTEIRQEKFKGCGGFIILGLPNALLSFSLTFIGIVLSDLIIFRTCQFIPNVNRTSCYMLRTNSGSPEALELEAKVEPYASMVLMAKSLIESILPTMISLFIGPWSDRGGRRPVILAGLTGFIIMFTALSFMSNWDVSPWYLLIPSIPAYIMGGSCTVTLASNCYVSDTMEPKDRTVLLAWLQTSILGGATLGIITGSSIYKNYGYTIVFTIAAVCCTCALLHTYFFVPESIKDASKESLHSLFQISFLKEIVTSSIIKRDGFHRPIVWLAMLVFTIFTMITLADMNLVFLFTRARLGWDAQSFSYLCGIAVVASVIGMSSISLLNPFLGLSDTTLAIVSLTSGAGAALTRSFTWKGWHMYLSVGIGVFHGVVGPVIRSIISKFIPAQDVGKIFSLIALLETLSPIGGAPLITLVYSNYLPPIYPCPVFIVVSSLLTLSIICVVCIEVLIRNSRKVQYIPAAQEDNIKS